MFGNLSHFMGLNGPIVGKMSHFDPLCPTFVIISPNVGFDKILSAVNTVFVANFKVTSAFLPSPSGAAGRTRNGMSEYLTRLASRGSIDCCGANNIEAKHPTETTGPYHSA
jgi:hypothetical protein